MSVEDLLKKRRQIRETWDPEKIPSKELINDLLSKAFDLAPSKQNLYPFKILSLLAKINLIYSLKSVIQY